MEKGNVFLVYVKSGHTEALFFDVPCFVPSVCSLSELKSLVSHHLGGCPSPEDVVLARADYVTLLELDEDAVRNVHVLFVYTAIDWQARRALQDNVSSRKECEEAVAETVTEPVFLETKNVQFIRAKGEMAVRIRDYNWAETQLGALSMWSESLLSCVYSMLCSKFPMILFWGSKFVTIYNDGYVPIFGAKHPLSLGKPGQVIWSEVWKDIGPMLEGVMRAGEATWSKDQLLVMSRNGYVEECYFTFSFSPVFTKGGEVGGAVTVVIETTERFLGERRFETLRDLGSEIQNQRNINDVAEITLDVLARNPADVPFALIYLLDQTSSKMVLAGGLSASMGKDQAPAEVSIISGEVQFGWPLAAALESNDLFEVDDLRDRLGLFHGCPWPGEFPHKAVILPLKCIDGSKASVAIIMGVNPRRAFDEAYRGFVQLIGGQLASAVSMAQAYDNERKRAEALLQLDHAKSVFFSNVSHEFRTPLTLMAGPIEVLLSDTRLGAEHREQLSVVSRNTSRLLKLVNSLLDFSRIEADRMQGTLEPTNISLLTCDLISCFRSLIENAKLEFVVNIPPINEVVYIDKEMYEKVVFNLLSNAFKFTLKGSICVSLRTEDSVVELRVKDSGIGIPKEELANVFERFHRIENSHGRSFEGSGIGLALTQDLVKLQGGSIRVESTLGEGSVFIVRFPLGKEHLPLDQQLGTRVEFEPGRRNAYFIEEAAQWSNQVDSAKVPSQLESYGRSRILVVDDNKDMCQHLRNLLAKEWIVETVGDGVAALQSLELLLPDLILSDVMMPRMNGFQLLSAVRDSARTKLIPFIMLSARAGEESSIEGLRAGADDYLVKPFSANELMARVRSQLELGRLRIRLEEQVSQRTAELSLSCEAFQTESCERLRIEKQLGVEFARRVVEAEERRNNMADFIDTVCHEIRNPLNCILAASILLLQTLSELENLCASEKLSLIRGTDGTVLEKVAMALDYCKSVETAAEQQKTVVDDVLNLSNLDSNQSILNLAPFNLSDLLQKLLQMYAVQSKSKGVKFTVLHLPEGADVWVKGDQNLLVRVLSTLVSNAIKFTSAGEVTVTARIESYLSETNAALLRFEVKDTGCGMRVDKLATLFDRFAKVNRRKASDYASSGLGLTISKKLVELMGGTMEVGSRENEGSEFTFTAKCFHLTSDERKEVLASSQALSLEANSPRIMMASGGRRILVVDDSATNRRMLAVFLKMREWSVVEAVNGIEAVKAVEETTGQFSLIFMDVEMPLMDGIEATRQIRRRESLLGTHTPIIGLSGYTSQEIQEKAAKAGMDHYLTKPFKKEAIFAVVDKFGIV